MMKHIFRYSWLALIFTIPFESAQITVSGFDIRVHQIVLLGTLITGGIAYRNHILSKTRHIATHLLKPSFVYQHIYPLLFTSVAFLFFLGGVFFGQDISATFIRSAGLFGFIAMFGLVYYGIRSRNHLKQVFSTLFFASGVLIIVGLYEAIAFQIGWPNFMYFPGRVDSIFPEPNWFALFISFIYALIIPLYYFSQSLKEKIWLLILLLGITLSSILTMGRASWLTIGIMLIIFCIQIIVSTQKNRNLVPFLVTISAVSLFAIGLSQTGLTDFNVKDRFTSIFTHNLVIYEEDNDTGSNSAQEDRKSKPEKKVIRDVNVDIRYESYQTSIQRATESPLIGQGPTGEHNLFLGVLVGSGILGLSLYVTAMYLMLKQSTLFYNRAPQYSSFVSLGVVSLIITGMFNDSFLMGFVWLALAICARIPDLIIDEDLDNVSTS